MTDGHHQQPFTKTEIGRQCIEIFNKNTRMNKNRNFKNKILRRTLSAQHSIKTLITGFSFEKQTQCSKL